MFNAKEKPKSYSEIGNFRLSLNDGFYEQHLCGNQYVVNFILNSLARMRNEEGGKNKCPRFPGRTDWRRLPFKGDKMTLSNVIIGKGLSRVSQKDASCDEHARWHLELGRFEPAASFPFSYYCSLTVPPSLQKKFCKAPQPSVCCG